MNLLTFSEAKAQGLKRYFTGVPCPYGHVAERIVSTRACVLCARERKHKWNAENPDKANAQKRAYCRANPEKVKAWKREEHKRDLLSERARKRRWYEKNRERVIANAQAWAKANPKNTQARCVRHRVAKMNQVPTWADHSAISLIYRAAEVMRISGFDVSVDHIIPLQGKSVRGLHVHTNLQIIDSRTNKSKSNSFLI